MDDRKLDGLRAIVEDYVSTQEPVGSKALVERHGLGVSPATIRNDMAALEEEGLITQPHTSAGRVPTDAGYRLVVGRPPRSTPTPGAAPRGGRGAPERGVPAVRRPAHRDQADVGGGETRDRDLPPRRRRPRRRRL